MAHQLLTWVCERVVAAGARPLSPFDLCLYTRTVDTNMFAATTCVIKLAYFCLRVRALSAQHRRPDAEATALSICCRAASALPLCLLVRPLCLRGLVRPGRSGSGEGYSLGEAAESSWAMRRCVRACAPSLARVLGLAISLLAPLMGL